MDNMMSVHHKRWQEFVQRLEEELGRLDCKAGSDKRIARKVLRSMGYGQRFILASCDYFELNGGYCDCEILLNVAYR